MQGIRSNSNRSWKLGIGLLMMFGLIVGPGCHSTRGVMYIQPERVGAYIKKQKEEGGGTQAPADTQPPAKDGKAPAKDGKAPAKDAPAPAAATTSADQLLRWKNLENVPDGNRILGGFCTDAEIKGKLDKLQQLEPKCNNKVNKLSKDAKLQGILYWSFLGATVASGAGMIVGGLLATPDVGAPLAVGFGIATLTFALTNGIGGFDGRQERLKLLSSRLDNYMWTLRLRIMFEVCNAKDVDTARQQLTRIMTQSEMYCSEKVDDGTYNPPK